MGWGGGLVRDQSLGGSFCAVVGGSNSYGCVCVRGVGCCVLVVGRAIMPEGRPGHPITVVAG